MHDSLTHFTARISMWCTSAGDRWLPCPDLWVSPAGSPGSASRPWSGSAIDAHLAIVLPLLSGTSRKGLRLLLPCMTHQAQALSVAQPQPKRLQHRPHGACISNNIEVHGNCARDIMAKVADFVANLLILLV